MSFSRWIPLRRLWRKGALGLAVFSILASGKSFSSTPVPSRVSLIGVPEVIQLPNYCGPAALSSLLGYWGRPVSQKVIARSVYDKKLKATNGADLLLFARQQGFSAFTYLATINDLKEQLRAGVPALVLQDMSSTDHRGHFRVVVGYSDILNAFLVRDSNYEDIRRISYDEFEKTWNAFGRWELLVCPKGQESKLKPEIRNNPVLHLDLGQAYLHQKQTDLARQHFLIALQLEPRNEEAKDMLSRIDGRKLASYGGAVKAP